MNSRRFNIGFALLIICAALLVASKVVKSSGVTEPADTASMQSRQREKTRGAIGIEPTRSKREVSENLVPPRGSGNQLRLPTAIDAHPGALHWSLDELEAHFAMQKSLLSSADMARMVRRILPEPVGASSRNGRLLPGSIAAPDQTRLILEYVDYKYQQEVFSFFWNLHKDDKSTGKPSKLFLGEVAPHLEPGFIRERVVQNHAFYVFNDYEQMMEILRSPNPINSLFPAFEMLPRDEEQIINCFTYALREVVYRKELGKSEAIELVENSFLESGVRDKVIGYINKQEF